MRTLLIMGLLAGLISTALGQTTPPKVELKLADQFDQPHDIADFKGKVVILIYGDRHAVDENSKLGNQLYVYYHPDAKDKPPAEAKNAPVIGLAGVPATTPVPDVRVIPVACTGKVPELVLTFVKREVKKQSPDVPVWIDSQELMQTKFGLRDKEPNMVIIDTQGRLRLKIAGTPDKDSMQKLVDVVDRIRREAIAK
ncbi:MAG: hypothetical protein R3B84_08965 [Zavarzinella sp.]